MRWNFWQQQFTMAGDNPGMWVLEARRLRQAADTIFDAYVADVNSLLAGTDPDDLQNLETINAASLLYGLSLENAIKALILQKKGSLIRSGKLIRWSGSGHDLVRLAGQASVQLDESLEDLLARLSAYIEWAGRYPIPKSHDKMAINQRNVSPEWIPLPLQVGERRSLDEFLNQIEERALAYHCTAQSSCS